MAKVPANQSNILHFFKLVKPLAEGCVFSMKETGHKSEGQLVKLEVLPRLLHKVQVLEANASQTMLKQIEISHL